MNILFITAQSPPSRFHRIRALNLIKYLSRSHDIHLVSLTRQPGRTGEELKPYCKTVQLVYQSSWRIIKNCLLSVGSHLPLEVAYCANPDMNRAVRAVLEQHPIDLIYIKRLRSAPFVPPLTAVPTIVDTTDAMSLYYERAKDCVPWYIKSLFRHEWRAYQKYEKQMLAQYSYWISCSPIDTAYLQRRAPPATRIQVVPNGVDAEYYAFDQDAGNSRQLLLSGLMDKFVNVQAAKYFVRDIFPKIQLAIPDVRLMIVGPRPTPAVRRLATKDITVTGVVPDLRRFIRESAAVVCPVLTGAGTRNKILQAWSIGRPIITTPQGLEGLDGIDGTHVLVAGDADTFAAKTVRLLQDRALRQQLVENGRALVNERYTMDIITSHLHHKF